MSEYWDIYDANRNFAGKTIKRGEPFGENEFYVCCEVWVINSKNQLLVTQRHPDKKAGGLWEFTGGGVLAGETTKIAAIREAKEELGVDLNESDLELHEVYRYRNYFMDIYVVRKDFKPEDIKLDANEVVDWKWLSASEIEQYIKDGKFVRSVGSRYVMYGKQLLASAKMAQIELIEPGMDYADEIWAFRQEIMDIDAENEDQFAGCMSLNSSESAEEWINICTHRKSEETCEQVGTNVPSHMYLAVRKADDKVVGVIDLRHHINHPILGTWGGHCGYSVRPSERGKGYAKEMLRLNIENAKTLGISKLLVTCSVTNKASEKTILANGGVFENTIDVDGTVMKRYWITVS